VSTTLLELLGIKGTSFKLGRLDIKSLPNPMPRFRTEPCITSNTDRFSKIRSSRYLVALREHQRPDHMALATLNAIDESDCKVLEEIPNIISKHAAILNPSVRERSYGFGWTRIQLPGVVGIIGGNFPLWSIKDQPILGNKNLLMLYHQGSIVGYYTHIALFPDTKSAVIALSSSIALSDPTDWMLRAKIQALFDFEDGQDYVKLVVEAHSRQIAQYATLARQVSLKLESCADPVKSIPLEAFVGRYSPIRTKGTEVFVGGHSRNQLEAGDSLRHKETDLYTRNITYLPP